MAWRAPTLRQACAPAATNSTCGARLRLIYCWTPRRALTASHSSDPRSISSGAACRASTAAPTTAVEVCRNCDQDFYRAYADDPELDLEPLIAKTRRDRKRAESLPDIFLLADEPHGDDFPIHFTYRLYDNSETSDEESEEGLPSAIARR